MRLISVSTFQEALDALQTARGPGDPTQGRRVLSIAAALPTACVRLGCSRQMRCAGEGTSTNMMRVNMPAGTRRWPVIVIAVLILLFIGFTVMSGFYVDLLWFREVKLSSVFWSVLRTKVMLGLIFGLLFFALLYVNLLIVRWLTPTTRYPHPRTGGRRPRPSGPGAVPAVADPARLRRPRAHRGARRLPRVADVPAVAERLRAFVRHHRTALPSRPVVLRVLVAVAPLRAGVALLLPRRRDADRGDRAFRMGWDPAAGASVRRQGGCPRCAPTFRSCSA